MSTRSAPLTMNANLIDDYPLFDDPDFYMKIYRLKEFYDCRYTEKWWDQWKDMSKPFRHLPHQNLIYNYMSPCTPYMSVFLFHGCGSGKSECASRIVESNKLMLGKYNENTDRLFKLMFIYYQMNITNRPCFSRRTIWC